MITTNVKHACTLFEPNEGFRGRSAFYSALHSLLHTAVIFDLSHSQSQAKWIIWRKVKVKWFLCKKSQSEMNFSPFDFDFDVSIVCHALKQLKRMQFKPEPINLFKKCGQFRTYTVSVTVLIDLLSKVWKLYNI